MDTLDEMNHRLHGRKLTKLRISDPCWNCNLHFFYKWIPKALSWSHVTSPFFRVEELFDGQWFSKCLIPMAHASAIVPGEWRVFTVTLDAAADTNYGGIACYKIRDAAEQLILDVTGTEKINLNGTATSAGEGIAATGAGESVCVMASTDVDGSGTDGYYAWGPTSGWDEETP